MCLGVWVLVTLVLSCLDRIPRIGLVTFDVAEGPAACVLVFVYGLAMGVQCLLLYSIHDSIAVCVLGIRLLAELTGH